ncbi:putative branched-chain amino acid transport system II carrier protein [Candidatus Protochlamydia naegleriophila]|uniref:Putative branched-chain amino acid transport system II carrier protein n=1 Tax=Candidatus Protochlamydia naegleriophila TaxID=389348 RepID=A0A0U5JAW8_9BACT|nr:branched-chain amino acid transport system II carrier protein [Candidatus Protochlamydia naegleriophila]CUI16968.1 putative branched-chain amino acid transport system II carrier protein [Candidatus Protochlamydia naegleriophila]
MFSVSHSRVLSTGLAMFSMFFGAGNVVFPLVIGQVARQETPYAIAGLLLTAVGVPFLGLLAIFLFQGSYQRFFARLGRIPGFLLSAAIMLLIGPFGGLPRCIALSHATLKLSIPSLSFGAFSVAACLLIFACTVKKNRILGLLGYFLTPLLLLSLFTIVVMGLSSTSTLEASTFSKSDAFVHGLIEGYNTMDLLASFFFSSIIFSGLKQDLATNDPKQEPYLFQIALKASCIGGLLLSLVYIGFSYVAAYHSASLSQHNQGELLGALTLNILGPYAGIVASMTIALACLTTAIALATVFAEFLQKTLNNRISYVQALLLTLLTGYTVSTLEFTGIVSLLAPLLQVAYPALIAFTIANIAYCWYKAADLKASEW